MLKINNALITARGLVPGLNCVSPQIVADNAAAINSIVANGGVLPVNPPFEIHPYLDTYELGQYGKYIIGTFPPISYLADHPQIVAAGIPNLIQPGLPAGIILRPIIPFYHGNAGDMWDYLLTPAECALFRVAGPNKKQYLIKFITENAINYCDIINRMQRRLNNNLNYDFADKWLNNICINHKLIYHILMNPDSERLLFNTSSTFSQDGLKIHVNINDGNPQGRINVNSNSGSFDLFVRGCQDLGLKVELRIQIGPTPFFPWTVISVANVPFLRANMHNKIAFEMRISTTEKVVDDQLKGFSGSRIFTVITGPSPSGIAQLGIQNNQNYLNWHALIPLQNNASAFIKYIYQTFRFDPIANLYALNI